MTVTAGVVKPEQHRVNRIRLGRFAPGGVSRSPFQLHDGGGTCVNDLCRRGHGARQLFDRGDIATQLELAVAEGLLRSDGRRPSRTIPVQDAMARLFMNMFRHYLKPEPPAVPNCTDQIMASRL